MDAKFFPQTAELLRFLPEIILTIAGTLLLVLEGFKKDEDSVFRPILSEYYGKRKASKKIYMEIEDEIEQLKAKMNTL